MKIFTFKQGGFTAFLRATLLLVMMFTSSVTFADYKFPAYISDLKLIGGTEAETAQLLKKYKSEGWTCTDYDLNYGCKSGADRIYLLYKSTVFASTNGGFVTGLIIDTSSKFKETIKSDGHTYTKVVAILRNIMVTSIAMLVVMIITCITQRRTFQTSVSLTISVYTQRLKITTLALCNNIVFLAII